MQKVTVPYASIIVQDRQRKDMGDLDSLKNSIAEFGLIQPLVIDQNHRLIAGGRRHAAIGMLGWSEVPVYYRETLSERQIAILELLENHDRKNMTWQEEARSVARIHYLQVNEAALQGDDWPSRMTGEMMGLSKANVNFLLVIAKELDVPGTAINECSGFWDAVRYCTRKREDEAQAVLAKMIMPVAPVAKVVPTAIDPLAPLLPMLEPTPATPTGERTVNLSGTILRGDCLELMSHMDNGSIDHIITDPPYAIDMAMLNQNNPHGGMEQIDRIEKTHEVEPNLELLSKFIPEAFRVTNDRAFLVMFCDPMRWQWLYDQCITAGWKVQRWPFIWHKTHNCMNQAAQANTTKNYEFAILCRKPKAVLKKTSPTSVFSTSSTGYLSNPFAKPTDLWFQLIELTTFIGETVLDPFMGEGSSTLACISCHRKPVGIEIDEKHYNVAVDEVKKLYDVVLRKPNYI